jgi:hypothetical protein
MTESERIKTLDEYARNTGIVNAHGKPCYIGNIAQYFGKKQVDVRRVLSGGSTQDPEFDAKVRTMVSEMLGMTVEEAFPELTETEPVG